MRHHTLYAAFAADGMAVINVYDFDRRRLALWMTDRKANGEAFPGEKAVRVTVAFYNVIRAKQGLSPVGGLR